MDHSKGRVRGIGLLGVIQALRTKRSQAEAALPTELRPYLDRTILLGNWYPETEHNQLLQVVATLYDRPDQDVWRWMGERTAELNLGGAYSHLLTVGDPEASFRRFPELWHRYRDTGRFEVEVDAKGAGTIHLAEYGYLHEGFCRLLQAYYRKALELAGAVAPRVEILRHDEATGSASWRARWS